MTRRASVALREGLMMGFQYRRNFQNGSIELIVVGLLAALIVVLAIPLLGRIGNQSQSASDSPKQEISSAQDPSQDDQKAPSPPH